MPKVVIFLQPSSNLLDLAAIIQVFNEAIEFGIDVSLSYCSESTHVTTIADFTLSTIQHFSQITLKRGDYLIVTSSNHNYVFSPQFKVSPTLTDWLMAQLEEKVNIIAVCNGAFVLGKAGLLNKRKCTTHWKRTRELKAMFPQAQVEDNVLLVEDNGITTSAGAASGIDLALLIVSRISNDYYSHKIARELVLFNRRDPDSPQTSPYLQYRNHFHTGIHTIQEYIIQQINKKHSLADLAFRANMSERNFCRIFKRETGVTVVEYINGIRQITIRELLKNPNLSKKQIAQRVGLESERQVSRILKQDLAGYVR